MCGQNAFERSRFVVRFVILLVKSCHMVVQLLYRGEKEACGFALWIRKNKKSKSSYWLEILEWLLDVHWPAVYKPSNSKK